jgi:hypothetical protein
MDLKKQNVRRGLDSLGSGEGKWRAVVTTVTNRRASQNVGNLTG